MRPVRVCLLGEAHPKEHRGWTVPVNDSREWLRVLGSGDVLSHRDVAKCPELVRSYDVVIVELTPATQPLPALLKRAAPDAACVALIEGRVEYVVRSHAEMESLFAFARSADDPDVLGVLVERTLPYYRLYAASPERVHWLGVPYPLDWTNAVIARGLPARPLVIELGSAMDSRNGIANVLVLRELQRRYPMVRGRIYVFEEREAEMVRALGVDADFRRPMPWARYYHDHLDAFAVVCLDDRRTWGRYVLDCASARMPFVGSNLSHCGERVGVMTTDPFDTERALAWLSALVEERLRGRDELYRDTVQRQSVMLGEYGADAARSRFAAALAATGFGTLAERVERLPAAVSA